MRKLPPEQQADEQVYLRMLQGIVASEHMYFSYTFDLTSSLQTQSAWTAEERRGQLDGLRMSLSPGVSLRLLRTALVSPTELLLHLEGLLESLI